MPKIHELSPLLANMIAAGEVVERPGSAAKELIENAIDAGAKSIVVEIKNGGISYLRVTDNGCGIAREDVRSAFLRHATSKLSTQEQLAEIETLGFRGEALAAIAAVAKIDMFTRTKDVNNGTCINIEGGAECSFGETGCPVGTTIVIRELFYNVPARAKFLKKDATEGAFIEDIVAKIAVANPGVAFKLIKDGREVLATSGNDNRLDAIFSIYGRDVATQLKMAYAGFDKITVDGYISAPALTRANRSMQIFYVNSRVVRSRLLSAALDEAYKNKIMTGRTPICFLNIKLPPSAVDINVHPAKLEVKFSHEKEIFSAVYQCVQSALEVPRVLNTELSSEPIERVTPQAPKIAQSDAEHPAQGMLLTFPESEKDVTAKVADSAPISYQTGEGTLKGMESIAPQTASESPIFAVQYETNATKQAQPIKEPLAKAFDRELIYIGEFFKTYLAVQEGDKVWLIDKHAAHERMIFNDLKLRALEQASQMLLLPVTVTLSPAEKDACMEHLEDFEKAGFELDDFGKNAVRVRQVPLYLDEADVPFVLSEMAEMFLNRRPAQNQILDELLKSVACKAAIKAGSFTDAAECARFAKQVLSAQDVENCPHGRPIKACITKYQLEKLFKRVL